MEGPVAKTSSKLPPRPNLDHLRSQAKTLLADLRAGNASAAATFTQFLPAAKKMTPGAVRKAGFRLADAQSAIARKNGFANWPGLARHVEQLRALEGEWAFESLEVDGSPMPPMSHAAPRLLIDGDRFRMESPDANYEGVFNIDAGQNPAHIDIEFVEGPEAGNWSYGIFKFEQKTLVFCLGLTGSLRPTRFATAKGSGHALERLRRASVSRPVGVTGGKRTAAPKASPAPAADPSAFALTTSPLLDRLQGEWVPVSLVTSGSALGPDMLSYVSRTQIGNETKVVAGGQTMVHALFRVDESQSPIAIDYLNVKGSKIASLGVLDWVGDDMRICMARAGDPRPADFTCAPRSGRTLSQWTRRSET